jgi:predicted PurR-regulated permease PerM
MAIPDRRTIDVLSTAVLFAAVLALLYAARQVIVIFIFAILFAYLINPVVVFLQRHSLFSKGLRGLHVAEVYVLFLVVLGVVGHSIAPGLFQKDGKLLRELPAAVDRVATGEIAMDIGGRLGWSDAQVRQTKTFLAQHEGNIREFVGAEAVLVTALIGAIAVIPILAIFFVSDGAQMTSACIRFGFRGKRAADMQSLADAINRMLKSYIRAKVILGTSSLVFYSAAMLLLGYSHAIALGVIGGILEFIPAAGWMITAAVIVTVGSLTHAHWIWMAVLLGIWRLVMDYFIAPRVMGNNLEVHPLLVLFAMTAGGAVGGIVGLYLSVPLLAILKVVWQRIAPPDTVDNNPVNFPSPMGLPTSPHD